MRSSCALLGGFAIGAWVSFLWQHSAEHEMSGSACTCFMSGFRLRKEYCLCQTIKRERSGLKVRANRVRVKVIFAVAACEPTDQ